MAGFSGALKLTDLDDFITPSQVSSIIYGYAPNPYGIDGLFHLMRTV